jgi:putative toxin-antitoxin system antitoxin component (TIGR02293 family)
MAHVMSVGIRKKSPAAAQPVRRKEQELAVREGLSMAYHPVQPEIGTLIRQIKRGYPIDKFERLKEEFGATAEKLAGIASISLATLHRRKVAAKHLTPEESEKVYRLEKLYATAVEVLDKKESARVWFNTPLAVFEGKTPLEYADTLPGAEEVERVLRRMEHGVVL